MDLLTLGKEPIDAENPAGTDVRYDPDFESLQAEIDKMSMPSASGGVDWKRVNQLSGDILAGKAKDLLVASYLAVAQIHINQLEGFVTGLTIYRDLLAHFWEDAYPTKKRKKGRVAAIEWWIEKTEAAVEGLQVSPLPPETVEGYRQIVQEIDELLEGYLEDAPLLRPFLRFIDGLPVKVEKKAETKPAPSAGPEEADKAEALPVSGAVKAPPPTEAGTIGTEADAERVTREVFKTLRRVADFFHANDLKDPKGYRWRRVAGWSMIHTLPPNQDNQTEIPPPVDREGTEQTLSEFKEKGNWEALIRSAEERFEGALLWMDLTRYTAEGLEGLGGDYGEARDVLCRETAYFLERIPGIENLSYSDGTPFCDHETRQWLKEIRFSGEDGGTGDTRAGDVPGGDLMAEALEKFQSLAKKRGKLSEAVQGLQEEMLAAPSRRDRMLWRMGLVAVLIDAKKVGFVRPHLDALLTDIERYQLEEWDPPLAVKGLRTIFLGMRAMGDKDSQDEASGVLGRIARLDPMEGLKLGKG